MKARLHVGVIAAAICSSLVIAGVAWAGASTKITLSKGLDNPHGKIFSSSNCVSGRKVIAFQQKGSSQNPSVDKKMDTTTSSRQDNHGIWDMGNPGFPQGKRYYVEATKKAGCKAAFSQTVKFTTS